MEKYVGYIPVKKFHVDSYEHQPLCNSFYVIKKYPIKQIKINKKYFAFQNEVDEEEVIYMLFNFDRKAWEPIMINEKGYLLDGQHRLKLAEKLGLNYIDVVIRRF
ncbi:MAG: ParB/RepB/Spo0J family partition protein [candidate division Zixibacteria bacterium]|nr:ParB/RepB/Spo0J family partition protein [candidate division Zixibacteria bacterium]MDD5425574.1 ParB/RepB/Spo0J family partition protein [candidate division Zixibacteria bacterium]